MKTSGIRSGNGRGARKKDATGGDWEQQVDYPVPQERDADAGSPPSQGNSLEERIRFKAWLRAKERGFAGGDEVADWLEAEREVNAEERERGGGTNR